MRLVNPAAFIATNLTYRLSAARRFSYPRAVGCKRKLDGGLLQRVIIGHVTPQNTEPTGRVGCDLKSSFDRSFDR